MVRVINRIEDKEQWKGTLSLEDYSSVRAGVMSV